MSTWLRSALMWVLVTALPLQAVAAATMMHCGSLPNRTVHVHDAADGPAHTHAGNAVPGHDHRHDAGASAAQDTESAPTLGATPSTRGESGTHALRHDAKSKCSVCASCCTATALPPAIQSFDAAPSTDFFAPFMPLVAPVFLTGGPERPPRPVLA